MPGNAFPALPNPAAGIGALGGAGQQFLSFLQGLPQQIQQWQQVQQQQQANATQGLQQMAQIGAAIPAIASSPGYINSVSRYLRQMHVDPSLVVQNGSVNIAAIGGQSQGAKLLADPSFMEEAAAIEPSQRSSWWAGLQVGPMPDIIAHLPYQPRTTSHASTMSMQLLQRVWQGADPISAATQLRGLKGQMSDDEYTAAVLALQQAGRSQWASLGQQTAQAKLQELDSITGMRDVQTRTEQYRLANILPEQLHQMGLRDQQMIASTAHMQAATQALLANQVTLRNSGRPVTMSLSQYGTLSRGIAQQVDYWKHQRDTYQNAIAQQEGTLPAGVTPATPQQIQVWRTLESQANAQLAIHSRDQKTLGTLTQAVGGPGSSQEQTRVINKTTYYKHADGKWYTSP